MLVDFASPNVGKALHVGHLRSAVIGACPVCQKGYHLMVDCVPCPPPAPRVGRG